MRITRFGIISYALAVLSLCAAGFFAMFSLSPGFRWHTARVVGNAIEDLRAPSRAELESRLADLTGRTTATPGDQAAWVEMADVQMKLGRYPEAIGSLDRATGIEPPDGRAYVMKAEALKESYKLFEAVKVLKEAASALPDDPDVNLKLAQMLLALDEPAGALVYAKASAALRPSDAVAVRVYGDSLVEAGLYEDALDAYGHALGLRTGEPEFFDIPGRTERGLVYYGMGRAYNALGRFDDALEMCKSADVAVPNGGFSVDNRVYALAGKGEYGEAIVRFQNNIDVWDMTKSATVYAYAVKKRGGKGDDERLRSTLNLIYDNAQGDQLIYAHAVAGDRDIVLDLLRKTVAAEPYMKRVVLARIEMRDMLGDPEIAGLLAGQEGRGDAPAPS